jgi:arginine exporter protein ArgO
LALILGVFLGSTSWWLILSTGANALRARFMTPAGLQWVNRLSGLIIVGFGLAAIWLNR